MEIFSARIFLPLFHVKYREAWGVRLSSRMPPPRTILGALAKGLGIILGIESGETLIKGKRAREFLTESVEVSSYGFVRPLSPLVKTSQILRVVPAIEQDRVSRSKIINLDTRDLLKEVVGLHDAFKHDIVFSNEMEFIYVIDLEYLKKNLAEYGCEAVEREDIISALKMIDRVGPTEALGRVLSVKYIEHLVEENLPSAINAYVPVEKPAKWVEPLYDVSQRYLIEPLYPNLRLIDEREISRKTREIKINFLLPLTYSKRRGGREIFEPSSVLVKPAEGYSVYSFDGAGGGVTKIALPKGEIKNELV